ncbi:MAG: DUF1203 domain-containing protein [Novosphingobium sp.]
MAYRITGLPTAPFVELFGLSDEELAVRQAMRVTATSDRGFPCRVSLEDALAGEQLLLLNHVSHDVTTPYRSSYAIYVRKGVSQAALPPDTLPKVFAGRPLGLRGFGVDGLLKDARLALSGEVDAKIRELFADPRIHTIHVHNAAHGCFVARVERDGAGGA